MIFNTKVQLLRLPGVTISDKPQKQMEFNGSKKQLALNLSKYEATLGDKLVTLQFEKTQWHRKK